MALQTGLITLSGKIDNQVFYEKNGKDFVRKASSKPIRQTAATKRASADFGRGSTAAALIRKTFALITKGHTDWSYADRTKKHAQNVIVSASVELRGRRTMADGDVALLKSLEFNKYGLLSNQVRFTPEIKIDNAEALTIILHRQEIEKAFDFPSKAGSVKLQFLCGIFHFDLKKAGFAKPKDLVIHQAKKIFSGGKITLPLQAAENSVILVGMTAKFYNSDNSPINDRRHYGGRIIEAVNIVDGKIVEFKYAGPPREEEIRDSGEEGLDWEMNPDDGEG